MGFTPSWLLTIKVFGSLALSDESLVFAFDINIVFEDKKNPFKYHVHFLQDNTNMPLIWRYMSMHWSSFLHCISVSPILHRLVLLASSGGKKSCIWGIVYFYILLYTLYLLYYTFILFILSYISYSYYTTFTVTALHLAVAFCWLGNQRVFGSSPHMNQVWIVCFWFFI